MLSLIRIRNYAVIDEVEVELEGGFSVMTGETGAGKSILVDALGLVLGDRADASAVRHGTSKAEISVLFECPPGHPSLDWLCEHGLDDDNACSLRRVISAEGRSRAFVNNQPVTLQDLRELGSLLVDIHGQHAHQSLLAGGEQRRLLDAYGGLDPLAEQVAALYASWQALVAELSGRRSGAADREARLELMRFQLGELEALDLSPGEFEEIETEMRRLAHVEQLAAGVQGALECIDAAEGEAAHALVTRAARLLAGIAPHDESLREPAERLEAVEIELRDIASALTHYSDRLDPDPRRLELLEARTGKARALALRHGVAENRLHEVTATLRAELDDSEGGDRSLETLEAEAQRAHDAFFERAAALSAARADAAKSFARNVAEQMTQLGFEDGRFHVEVARRHESEARATGLDAVEFQVSLNAGQPLAALARVASGGELSRISLAIEVVSAADTTIPTLVFDEVDAGIGGRVAEIVGMRLAEIAGQRQVLCVTHLPQVASRGKSHYRVVKLSDGETTHTQVQRLEKEARVEELSRMLGGVEITQRTRDHAEEMIAKAAE